MQNNSISQLAPITLGDLWNTVLRRFWVVALIMAAMIAFGIIYLKVTPRIYEAEAVILLDTQEKNVEIKSVLSEVSNDQSLVPSEIQVLISRNLMDKVLSGLDVPVHPEYILGKTKKATQEIPDKEMLISVALDALTVKQVEKSRAISIVYQSQDPVMAAKIINKLTEIYIEQQISHNFEAVRLTNSWLAERVEDLQTKVRESEQKVADYRARAGLVNNKGNALVEQSMSELSTKLIDAKAQLSDAQARLAEVRGGASSAPSVLSSPLIQSLRTREADARNRFVALSEKLGPSHPQILSAQAEVEEIETKIRQESSKIAEGLNREYKVAQNNVSYIQGQINSLKGQYNSDTSDNVELAELEREAETNRKFLETINLRWKETQSQEDSRLQTPYARILSPASVPTDPSAPKKKLILATALIAGIGFGLAVALALDQMQNTIYNGKQLQTMTGVTNISLISKVGKGNPKIKFFADMPLVKPNSAYMEGIREISSFIKLEKNKDPSQKVFSLISSRKGEGKSALCASLSRQLALEGQKVVAIDCDIREPALTRAYGLNNKAGLTEVLSGEVLAQDVLNQDGKVTLSILPIGEAKRNVNVMVNAPDVWRTMLDTLAQDYDVILLDAPPVLSAPEAKIISKLGKNIFCVRWKKTPIKVLNFALDSLKRSGSSVSGTVVTRAGGKNASGQSGLIKSV